ncbi:unnamed protein product, partial [marine sediment metagenome]
AFMRTLKGAATRSALCSQQHGTSFAEYLQVYLWAEFNSQNPERDTTS